MADILGDGSSEPSAKRQKRAVAGLGPVLCERLRIETLHLCATTGALLGAAGPFHHAPCSLLPYPFPAPLFKQAIDLAKPFNSLVDRVARDVSWLTETVRTTVEHDPFTRRLLEILETVQAEGITQPLQLSINRSDYMIDQPTPTSTPRILQVELNTVSVSFVSLGAKMTEVSTQQQQQRPCVPSTCVLAHVAAAMAQQHAYSLSRSLSSLSSLRCIPMLWSASLRILTLPHGPSC